MKKLCLLVGGSKGLGLALLEKYSGAEFRVEEFSRSGTGETHTDVDLARRESIDVLDQRFTQLAEESWDEVHLVINAGSLFPIGPLHMSEPKQWWQSIDINFTMPITILGRFQTVFKDIEARKVAAFVSSGAASHAFHGWSLYGANKAGVDQFLASMALEQAKQPFPIFCASLNPGVMDTDMQAQIRSSSEDQFSDVQGFIERYESGGLVAPEVVAENIFVALNGDFENGASIRVAGY